MGAGESGGWATGRNIPEISGRATGPTFKSADPPPSQERVKKLRAEEEM